MKIIIKIGTSSLTNEDGSIKQTMLTNIAETTRKLMDDGHETVIVTSGAVGCGKGILKYALEKNLYIKDKEFCKKESYTTKEKTVLSGIGQKSLISYYWIAFERVGLILEQVLMAGKRDIENSTAQDNIELCLQLGIVPIVNANDTVYDKELIVDRNERFDDNDTLSSKLAKMIGADALFLVTNVEGYYDKEGNVIEEITFNSIDGYIAVTDETTSTGGTGGMVSKLNAGKNSDCDTYIIPNMQIGNIDKVLQGEKIGTKICKKSIFIDGIKIFLSNDEKRKGDVCNEGNGNNERIEERV